MGSASRAASEPSGDAAAAVVVTGRGFGHGVGMPQDGAYAMGKAGASAGDILARFYPGTSIGRRGGLVRVGVYEASGAVTVSLPGGGEIRQAGGGPVSAGFPVVVGPGGTVALAFAGGAYRATPLSGASLARSAPPAPAPAPVAAPAAPVTAPPPTGLLDPLVQALAPTTVPAPPRVPVATPPPTTVPAPTEARSARSLVVVPRGDSVVSLPGPGRRYRGTMEAAAGGGGLQLTNALDVEQYLRGMAEVPADWPAATLQAQAIAARTFALRAAATGRTLCDDQQCQVYVGADAEHPATDAAAAATRGRVLVFDGALAEALYSASAGGVSATPKEGFGRDAPDVAYLSAAEYEAPDAQPWSATFTLRQLGARFGYRGEPTSVRVTQTGPSGRPLELTFEGEGGPMAVDGYRFWTGLGLRSSLFTVRLAGQLDDLVPGLSPVTAISPGRVLEAAARPGLGRLPWIGAATLSLAGALLGRRMALRSRR